MKTKKLKNIIEMEKRNKEFKKEFDALDFIIRVAVEIARKREQRGITQKQLAEAVGTTQTVISRIESGKQNLSLEMLYKISKALNSGVRVEFVELKKAA